MVERDKTFGVLQMLRELEAEDDVVAHCIVYYNGSRASTCALERAQELGCIAWVRVAVRAEHEQRPQLYGPEEVLQGAPSRRGP